MDDLVVRIVSVVMKILLPSFSFSSFVMSVIPLLILFADTADNEEDGNDVDGRKCCRKNDVGDDGKIDVGEEINAKGVDDATTTDSERVIPTRQRIGMRADGCFIADGVIILLAILNSWFVRCELVKCVC